MQATVITLHIYRATTSTHQRKSVFENFISSPDTKEHSRVTRVVNLIKSKYVIYPEKPMDSCISTDQFSKVSSLYILYRI